MRIIRIWRKINIEQLIEEYKTIVVKDQNDVGIVKDYAK